ncbi:hypothetical protein T484DRAFT_1828651 [Baffinella frigidus]|nr:hypothetical protein T484DRAFT_1828651 [Cryptophyta sp. CCMP2293]
MCISRALSEIAQIALRPPVATETAPVKHACQICRWCHNEAKDEGCSDPKKAHQMDRFAVENAH